MTKKKQTMEFKGPDPKKEEKDSYIRVRPKGDSGAAFYAPSADITHIMKHCVSSSLRIFDTVKNKKQKEKLSFMAISIAEFMRDAVLSGKTWEENGLPALQDVFNNIRVEDTAKFLLEFFLTTMDLYWHSMRLTTDAPELNPEKMGEALDMSFVLRTMPAEMRVQYLDHLKTYNLLPKVFDKEGLFLREELKREEKD